MRSRLEDQIEMEMEVATVGWAALDLDSVELEAVEVVRVAWVEAPAAGAMEAAVEGERVVALAMAAEEVEVAVATGATSEDLVAVEVEGGWEAPKEVVTWVELMAGEAMDWEAVEVHPVGEAEEAGVEMEKSEVRLDKGVVEKVLAVAVATLSD